MSSGAPIEHGTQIRMPSTALMLVNSDDQQRFDANGYRIDNEQPGRIYINKQRPIMFGYMTRLALTEMNIQWDTPNVNSTNNTMTLALYSSTDSATPTVALQDYTRVELLSGFYTPDELATDLQSELNLNSEVVANGLTFSVSYDDRDGSFRINQTATYGSGRVKGYFKIISGLAPTSLTGLPQKQDDLLYCMGIQSVTKAGVEPVGYYSVINGAYAPMLYTPYVDVVSNLLTKNQNVTDGTTSSLVTSSKLARIYLSNEAIINRHGDLETGTDVTTVCNIVGTRPITFRREFKTPKQIQWNTTENVDIIDIQVLDYKGNVIVIEEESTYEATPATNVVVVTERNNTSFQFTVQITEV